MSAQKFSIHRRSPYRSGFGPGCLLGAVSLLGILAVPGQVGAEERQTVIVTFDTATNVKGALRASSVLAAGTRIGGQSILLDTTQSRIAALADTPGVLAIEPNRIYRASDLPNDPCISSKSACNGMTSDYVGHIGLGSAWSNSHGAGVTIAVLDGGIDPTNSDVFSKMVAAEVDYVGDGASTHGTSVAALAAAATNNGTGVAGTGWDALLRSYKVLDQSGSGLLSNVITALNAAADSGARVINMSFAGPASAALDTAIAYARSKGAVVVASAGNESSTAPTYPAASPGVVGVGSVNSDNTIASFSNSGSWVDIYAPGVGIPAPNGSGAIAAFTGTSASAPIVSGVAALMLARSPELTADQVANRLASTALDIGNGALLVDAARAVSTWSPYQGNANGLRIAGGNVDWDPAQEVVTGAGRGGGPHVIVADRTGPVLGSFFAYDPAFPGGVDVAVGDLDGDGRDEIITGAGPGGGPHVRSFQFDGSPRAGFFAYDPAFPGGVSVAAGDVDGDGRDEIITGAGAGGGPNVTVRREDGTLLASFLAYVPEFVGGVDVAAGDLDGDGRDEIITGAGPGGGPHVQAFGLDATVRSSFYAYGAEFLGGVRVGTVDVDGDGRDDIVTGAGPGGGPHVTVRRSDATILQSLFAISPAYTGGVDVGGFADAFLASATTNLDLARIMPVAP